MNGEWRIFPRLPSVGGHEGVGRVVAIGAHSRSSVIKLGDRVGTKYVVGSCLQCEMCRRGFEQSGYTATICDCVRIAHTPPRLCRQSDIWL